jgi:hypothetical protein
MIKEFFNFKSAAVAGVSRTGKGFAFNIFSELKKRGFEVFPVNPNTDEINGEKCYRDLKSIPVKPDAVFAVTPKNETVNVVRQTLEAEIDKIWIQQGSETDEVLQICKDNNLNAVTKECIYLHLEPVKGCHAFHRWILKIFGKLKK